MVLGFKCFCVHLLIGIGRQGDRDYEVIQTRISELIKGKWERFSYQVKSKEP